MRLDNSKLTLAQNARLKTLTALPQMEPFEKAVADAVSAVRGDKGVGLGTLTNLATATQDLATAAAALGGNQDGIRDISSQAKAALDRQADSLGDTAEAFVIALASRLGD